ncbi:MAG: hypothetical protein ACTHMB_26380, partial [Candidatus Binatia bacterium]
EEPPSVLTLDTLSEVIWSFLKGVGLNKLLQCWRRRVPLIASASWGKLAKNANQVETDGSQRMTEIDHRLEMESKTGPTRERGFDIFLHGSY